MVVVAADAVPAAEDGKKGTVKEWVGVDGILLRYHSFRPLAFVLYLLASLDNALVG